MLPIHAADRAASSCSTGLQSQCWCVQPQFGSMPCSKLAYSFITCDLCSSACLQSNKLPIDCTGQLPVQLAYLGKERACPQTLTPLAQAAAAAANGALLVPRRAVICCLAITACDCMPLQRASLCWAL